MHTIHVERMSKDDQPTVGKVVVMDEQWKPRFQCFSLEDRFREEKVAGDTRIPEGIYKLAWRTAGRFAKRWQGRGFTGSLHLLDVPGFSTILIHAGNTHKDTRGCLLLGMGARMDLRTIQASRDACTQVYRLVETLGGEWQVRIQ